MKHKVNVLLQEPKSFYVFFATLLLFEGIIIQESDVQGSEFSFQQLISEVCFEITVSKIYQNICH